MEAWPEFDRKDVLGFWQTVMPRHEQKKKLFVDDEVLCGLFERLGETLGLVVDTARSDWVHISPVILALRMNEWVAADRAAVTTRSMPAPPASVLRKRRTGAES